MIPDAALQTLPSRKNTAPPFMFEQLLVGSEITAPADVRVVSAPGIVNAAEQLPVGLGVVRGALITRAKVSILETGEPVEHPLNCVSLGEACTAANSGIDATRQAVLKNPL